MNRTFYLINAIFVSFTSFGQDTIPEPATKTFIPLKMYVEKIGKITDTTEFIYRDKDTLVLIPNGYDLYNGKKSVRVEYEPKNSTFLNIYKNVVYNTGRSRSDEERMRYWKDDIKIYFDKSVPVSHTKELMQFADRISSDVDSLNISRNFIPEKANFLVYYLDQEHTTDYEPRIGNTKGGYYISWNGKQQIYDGKLKINTELLRSENIQLEHLKYHFFKSLGHFKSSRQLNCESYLSACNTNRVITPIDIEILKYHYSYGVCKGTDLKSFTDLTDSMNEKLKEDPNAKLYVLHHE